MLAPVEGLTIASPVPVILGDSGAVMVNVGKKPERGNGKDSTAGNSAGRERRKDSAVNNSADSERKLDSSKN